MAIDAEREVLAQLNPSRRLPIVVTSQTTGVQPKRGLRPEDLPNPMLRELVRHAEAFGTECVLEVGEGKLNQKDLARLRIESTGSTPAARVSGSPRRLRVDGAHPWTRGPRA